MSFKEEIDDAILHVSSIRQLVLLSRRPLATDKTSEEKEAKRKESLDSAKKVLGDLPAEKTDNIVALSVKSSPIEIDKILQSERAEFLLEDIKRAEIRKTT